MNNDLLNTMNEVIDEIDNLSDAEIQAMYEDSRNGLIGSALMAGRDFFVFSTYSRIVGRTDSKKWANIDPSFDFYDAANDQEYQFLMAA